MTTPDRPLPKSIGPEQETLPERLVGFFRLPYSLGSLLLALIGGAPTYYLSELLDTGDPRIGAGPNGVFGDVMFVIMPFYAFLAVKYMRTKIAEAEPKLTPLSAGGEESYHRAFGNVARTWPVILLAVPLFAAAFYAVGFNRTPANFVNGVISVAINALAYSSLFWTYIGGLRGIYSLGKASLRFRPFIEDEMLGVGSMGSLSLSLTFVYFGGLFLVGLNFTSNPIILAILLSLGAVGAVFFFLPLLAIHAKMQQEKNRELTQVRRNLARMMEAKGNPETASQPAGPESFQAQEYLERKAERIRTWPFDISVMGKLAAIILSVIAILLSRILQLMFHL